MVVSVSKHESFLVFSHTVPEPWLLIGTYMGTKIVTEQHPLLLFSKVVGNLKDSPFKHSIWLTFQQERPKKRDGAKHGWVNEAWLLICVSPLNRAWRTK